MEPTETPLQAACRELQVANLTFMLGGPISDSAVQEEAGVDAPLQKAGTLLFTTAGTPYAFHIDIFRSDSYTGRPVEYAVVFIAPMSCLILCSQNR